MKEIPILFSTPMVQAILEGRKTMTRRIINPQPDDSGLWNDDLYPCSLDSDLKGWNGTVDETGESKEFNCRYGKPGDVLWVRETFGIYLGAFLFRAGYNGIFKGIKWKPSIHMPKDYARIWLQVEEIRVERLEQISSNDARAEGIKFSMSPIGFCGWDYQTGGYNVMTTPVTSFMTLWRSVHGIERYEKTGNPWVWVIKFKVLSTTGKPEIVNRKL